MAMVALTIDASHGRASLTRPYAVLRGLFMIVFIVHCSPTSLNPLQADSTLTYRFMKIADSRSSLNVPICFRSNEKAGNLKLNNGKFKCEKAFTSEMEFS